MQLLLQVYYGYFLLSFVTAQAFVFVYVNMRFVHTLHNMYNLFCHVYVSANPLYGMTLTFVLNVNNRTEWSAAK